MAGFLRQLAGKGILEGATMNQPQQQQRQYFNNNSPWNMMAQAQMHSGGQQKGPWGSAMAGAQNMMASQNNMGQFQTTPQAPMGMGGNPMNNMMNPYQGSMQGRSGNPNQRQPFMGNLFGGFR